MENRFVYADNAATTPIDRRVLDKMLPFLTTEYGNASTLYQLGKSSHLAWGDFIAPRRAILSLSLPPPVKKISLGSAFRVSAISLRASSNAKWLLLPS